MLYKYNYYGLSIETLQWYIMSITNNLLKIKVKERGAQKILKYLQVVPNMYYVIIGKISFLSWDTIQNTEFTTDSN